MTISVSNPRESLILRGLYERSFVAKMSDIEAGKLLQLHQQRGHAFDAACDALAKNLGWDKAALSDEQRADVVAQVDDYIEEWDVAYIEGRYQHAVTPLRASVQRYRELGEAIMDIRDEILAR